MNFLKKISQLENQKVTEPISLYESLDRNSKSGPLRPLQQSVLQEWNTNRRNNKDIIIKLNTGAGKTLIGLLIALSYMYEESKPVIFVCPNIYLSQQVCDEAKKFGIPFCVFSNDDIPNDFLESKKILITHVQKVFNGLTKFGLDNNFTSVGTIILDDSHSCIEAISQACTIKINKDSLAYKSILELFDSDLNKQGSGSLEEIKSSEDNNTVMMIPYWAWSDKNSEVTSILADNKEEYKYAWNIIKNQIKKCNAFISSKYIEIKPECIPIKRFGTFYKANHRILMSATTQNDSFFIKGLNISSEAIKNPLMDTNNKWYGEKMILIPSLMDIELTEDELIKHIINGKHERSGIVILTPSFYKSKKYKEYRKKDDYDGKKEECNTNSIIVDNSKKENLFRIIDNYKKNAYSNSYLVLANRYDGIDFPDETCRTLIIDSSPICETLSEQYEEACRSESEILKIKKAQKIEQALGRSVRGEKDYSIIILLGSDLIRFIKTSTHHKFFSTQTQQQIRIGLDLVDMAKDENNDQKVSLKYFLETMNQCINRDESWKTYYKSKMDEIEKFSFNEVNDNMLKVLELEKNAYEFFSIDYYDKACEIIQDICNVYQMKSENEEYAWFMQLLAKYTYFKDKSNVSKLQSKAFQLNNTLLIPQSGIIYEKLQNGINANQVDNILQKLKRFGNQEDVKVYTQDLLNDLSFGTESSKFEESLKNIGEILGFNSQRPDLKARDGAPDNLWLIGVNKYIVFECKSKVKKNREFISKDEAGQMDQHFGWFYKKYSMEAEKYIIIIPTNKLDNGACFTKETFVMDVNQLTAFKNNLEMLFNDLIKYEPKSFSIDIVSNIYGKHGFLNSDFISNYITKVI